ncbi:MAG: DNA-directed RNA polymerase subunit F [Candidatus Bathyarchaeota archaeon]|nr:MAG: DNA-directed RNA polymerase subunit F [Candidatus Bathyarchaeota archaeon]
MSVDERKPITVAEAKGILERNLEELDPLQRRVHDYTVRFSKLSTEKGEAMVEELVEAGVDRGLAVQIANSLPESIGELRTFLGRRRIISEDVMNSILGIIEKYRSD